MRRLVLATALAALLAAAPAAANTSHAGWPSIDGMLLMNKDDSSRPLDGRPGLDPFGGQDEDYSCDSVHRVGDCQRRLVDSDEGYVVTGRAGHNELLGGHGSDTIHAGPWGDVLWGDYKPGGQPTSQHDRLFGGRGGDIVSPSHGTNSILSRGGDDVIHAHFGGGLIDCGRGRDTLFVSRAAQRRYTIRGCERVSHKTVGF